MPLTLPTPLHVLIVDDEPLARLRLRDLLEADPEPMARVAGEAADAQQALDWLARHPCDLLLLDVQMPGRDGTQLAAELRRLPEPPAVVFVTAHARHALQAFDLEAVDYLTKPVRRERLQIALQRVAERLAMRRAAASNGATDAGTVTSAASSDDRGALVVTDRGRVIRVPLGEVLYLKAELKYVTLRTAERSYLLDGALSELEHRIGDRFMRVHRNAVVARDAVQALERRVLTHPVGAERDDESADATESGEGWAVRIAPIGEWLAVSRRQVAAVREALVAAGR